MSTEARCLAVGAGGAVAAGERQRASGARASAPRAAPHAWPFIIASCITASQRHRELGEKRVTGTKKPATFHQSFPCKSQAVVGVCTRKFSNTIYISLIFSCLASACCIPDLSDTSSTPRQFILKSDYSVM